MNLLGTTGTRHIAQNDEPKFVDYLLRPQTHLFLSSFDGFVSGACVGWDAVFGSTMALTYPDKEHVVVVPADQSRVETWWHAFDPGLVKVVYMDDDTSYRDRNTEIVRLSSQLFYCADYPEDHPKSQRSGTWMTVRIARKAGMTPSGIIIHNEEVTND